MSKNSDASPSPHSDSSAWNDMIDDFIQSFQAAMQEQNERMEQAFQKFSDGVSAAFQIFKEGFLELHQKQVEKFSSETSDHSDANKHTGKRVEINKPIPEASAVVTPAKPISELRSPLENFQPASPKHVHSQQKGSEKTKDSNLFARMKTVERFRKEPEKSVQQQTVLSKPYVPPAPRVVIKENKWFVQEKGQAIELTPTQKRNMQRRFGRAKRALEALNLGLVKPKELKQTPKQLRRTVERLSARPIFAKRTSNIREPVPKKLQWQPKQVKNNNTATKVVPKSHIKGPELIPTEPVLVAPTFCQFIFCNIICQFGIFECLVTDRGAYQSFSMLAYFSQQWPILWPFHYHSPSPLPRLGGYT